VRDATGHVIPGAKVKTLSLDLAKDLLLPTGSNEVYSVRDLWRHKELPRVEGPDYVWKTGEIGERDSVFVLLTPVGA
jgi:hypothetical protein